MGDVMFEVDLGEVLIRDVNVGVWLRLLGKLQPCGNGGIEDMASLELRCRAGRGVILSIERICGV